MCYVKSVELPHVEYEFFVDGCPCLGTPRDMVEYWQPGDRHRMTTVRPVAEIERMSLSLWAVIQSSYSAWRDGPLLLEHLPAWPTSCPSLSKSQTASA